MELLSKADGSRCGSQPVVAGITPTTETAGVCVYTDSLAETFEEFCRTVWPRASRDPAESHKPSSSEIAPVDRARPDAPIFLFLKNEKAIGHVATIPVKVSTEAGIAGAHWIVGFMVLPEYRNGIVGPLLIKEVNRALNCALSLHVETSVLRILTGLKWIHVGVLPQYLRVVNANEFVRNLSLSLKTRLDGERWGTTLRSLVDSALAQWLTAASLTAAQRLWILLASIVKPGRGPEKVVEEQHFDESYTDLWRSVSKRLKASLVRDQDALRSRFDRTMDRYRVLACRHEDKLLGYCILKIKMFSNDQRLGNMKVGTIVDCLFNPDTPATLQALLSHAMEVFQKAGVHAVLCTASLREVRRGLLASGFFRIPGNLNFAFHARESTSLSQVPLEQWHLMRGDSDADQNF